MKKLLVLLISIFLLQGCASAGKLMSAMGAGMVAAGNKSYAPAPIYQTNAQEISAQQQFYQTQQQHLQYYRDIKNQPSATQPMTQTHTTCRQVGNQYICDSQEW